MTPATAVAWQRTPTAVGRATQRKPPERGIQRRSGALAPCPGSQRKREQIWFDPSRSRSCAAHRLAPPVSIRQPLVEQLRERRDERFEISDVRAHVHHVADDADPKLGQGLVVLL